jgi:hypothetical protein
VNRNHIRAAELGKIEEVATVPSRERLGTQTEIAPGCTARTTTMGKYDRQSRGVLANDLIMQTNAIDRHKLTDWRG